MVTGDRGVVKGKRGVVKGEREGREERRIEERDIRVYWITDIK